MKFKKTLVTIFTIFVLILSVVGCSTDSGKTGSTDSTTAETNTKPTGDANADTPKPVTLKMFVDAPWWPHDKWEGTVCEWATEQTGITFDVTIAPDMNALSLMIASGDLGDFIVSENFNRLANANICYDWDTLIEKHNIDFKIHPVYKYVNQASDGKMYTIMVGFSPEYEYKKYPEVNPEGVGLSCREDIYKELGSPKLDSIEALESLMAACKEKYPNMVPYTWGGDWQGYDRYLCALFGITYQNFVEDENGNAQLYINDPKWKDYLLTRNKWYRNGWISKENFSWTSLSTQYEWVVAGKSFISAMHCTTAQQLDQQFKDAGMNVNNLQLVDMDDPRCKILETSPGWRGMFIPLSCSNTEAAIRYCKFAIDKDTQYQMMWGIEGKEWHWNEDKTVAIYDYDVNDSEISKKMRRIPWGWLGHDGISNNMYTVAIGGKTSDGKAWVGKHIERMPALGMIRLDPDSEQYVIYESIRELVKNSMPDIVYSATEEEALTKYEAMMATVESLGGSKLEAWANERYPEFKVGYEKIKDIGEDF